MEALSASACVGAVFGWFGDVGRGDEGGAGDGVTSGGLAFAEGDVECIGGCGGGAC